MSDDVRPCDGALEFYDRFSGRLYEYWHAEPSPGDFHITLDLRSSDDKTLSTGMAMTGRGRAWARTPAASLHELSHLVLGWQDGTSAPSLSEGAAEAFGPAERLYAHGTTRWDAEEFVFEPRGAFEGFHYSSAAQLFAFLVRRYGLDTVRAAYRTVPSGGTREEIEAAFVDVFGDELYDAFDDFRDHSACPLFVWECDGSVLPVVELPLVIGREQTCDAPGTLGGLREGDELWFPYHMVTLDVGPSPVEVTFDVSDNVRVHLEQCVAVCEDSEEPFISLPALWTPLAAGRHVVSVYPIDATKPFSVTIDRAG